MNTSPHRMPTLTVSRHLRIIAAALALATLVSCATTGGVPPPPSMPAARLALRPEYRVFYDALEDYGDWVLIEPYGFVFHPKVDFATFRPYQDGFWAPSDEWGWVWISAEPFGWATYHYGSWFWDRYQGWVWTPGLDWGPAWVSWQLADRYAGWAPLPPPGGGGNQSMIPGGAFLYAPLERLGSTDLSAHVVPQERLAEQAARAEPADDVVEQNGVPVHRGPKFDLVERAIGARLPRVKLSESATPRGPAVGRREATPVAGSRAFDVDLTRREATDAAQRARTLIKAGGTTPTLLPMLRPVGIARPGDGSGARKRPAGPGAAPDSTR